STTAVGPNGGVATRDTSVNYDPATGVTRNQVTTRPNGDIVTRDGNAQWDPATQTYTRNGVRVGPDGQTQSADVTASRTDNGAQRTATRTRPDGSEVTRTQEVERDNGDDE
ncbi:MAG: hypothetical protein AAF270_15695, partial [Pseudomonadota bacterium]